MSIKCISFGQLIVLTIMLMLASSLLLPNGIFKDVVQGFGPFILFIMFLVNIFMPSLCSK